MKKINKEEMVQPLYDSNKIVEAINQLVKSNNNFALFRQPNQESITLFIETEGKAKESFHIAAFETSLQQKAIIKADVFLQNKDILLENIPFLATKNKKYQLLPKAMSKKEFEDYVAKIVEKCNDKEVEKVVAARTKIIEKPTNFDIGTFYKNLLNNYPTAFISIWQHSDFGLWCGATPETLIKQANSQFETMSLAGTKRIDANREWTAKEREEQQIVTDTILQNLANLTIKNINCTIAGSHKAGHIAHLKSTISFSTEKSIAEIAEKLHPTPAVGGLPLEKSVSIIKEYENENRSAYAGYLGTNDALYVNLRCMQVFDDNIVLYIGAGITKDSIPADEWQETENKAQTLLKFIR